MVIVSSSSNYELHHDQTSNIVIMKFIGDFTENEYKSFWNLAIDFGVSNNVARVIIHQQEIGNVSFKARAWAVMYAFPRVKKEMPKNLNACVISSRKIMQKTGMQYLLSAFVGFTGHKVQLCPTVDEAISLLRNKSAAP